MYMGRPASRARSRCRWIAAARLAARLRRRRPRGHLDRELRLRRAARSTWRGTPSDRSSSSADAASSSSAAGSRARASSPRFGASRRTPRSSSSSASWWAASAPTGPASPRRRCCGRSRCSSRARLTPGAADAVGPIDPEGVFAWRDEISEKDDTSQVEWLEKLDTEVVRGNGEVAEPGSCASGRASSPTTTSWSRPARAPRRRGSRASRTSPTGRAAMRPARARCPRA